MATIKRNGDKIILKNGKVSCTCCEEPECCMYPADQLGVTYTADDLPDTVGFSLSPTTDNPSGISELTLNLVTSGGNPLGDDADPYYSYYSDGDFVYCAIVGDNWELYYGISNPDWSEGNETPVLFGAGTSNCLNELVEDKFADSYEAIIRFDGAPDYTRTVTRISLCVWIYEDEFDFVQLRYSSTALGDFEKWDLSLTGDSGGFFAKKTDPQNTPVGEYDTGIGATATVSEA